MHEENHRPWRLAVTLCVAVAFFATSTTAGSHHLLAEKKREGKLIHFWCKAAGNSNDNSVPSNTCSMSTSSKGLVDHYPVLLIVQPLQLWMAIHDSTSTAGGFGGASHPSKGTGDGLACYHHG